MLAQELAQQALMRARSSASAQRMRAPLEPVAQRVARRRREHAAAAREAAAALAQRAAGADG